MPKAQAILELEASVPEKAFPVPEKLEAVIPPEIFILLGSLELLSVPLLMFVALVVSVVAEGAKLVPLVFVQVTTPVAKFIVQSPEAVQPPNAPELLY